MEFIRGRPKTPYPPRGWNTQTFLNGDGHPRCHECCPQECLQGLPGCYRNAPHPARDSRIKEIRLRLNHQECNILSLWGFGFPAGTYRFRRFLKGLSIRPILDFKLARLFSFALDGEIIPSVISRIPLYFFLFFTLFIDFKVFLYDL